jgi:hypothetical protein
MRAIREFRIGEGGLLRRFESSAGLTSLRRQIVAAVSLTWVPVVVLSLINERVTGFREPLVHAPSVHVRLLVAVPVLLTLDQVFPGVCRRALEQLWSQSFVSDSAQERFDRMLRSATRLADSMWPELLLALVAFGLGALTLFGLLPAAGFPPRRFTAAHVWYALADWPVLQFLLWRSLWRWLIWVIVLMGLSRFDLQLVSAHPDRRGGISFLRLPSIGYCAALLFAVSAVLCSDQAGRFARGVTLASYKPFLAAFGVAGALIAFGPLLPFSVQLFRLRREGRIQYAGLGSAYGREFHRRWIDDQEAGRDLQGSATQPLADLVLIYRETIDRGLPVLFDRYDLIVLLIATLLPMVPVMLMQVPADDWRELVGLLTGGSLR